MLTDNEIVTIARTEVERALGYDSDELATTRENALDYYHGKMASAPEGRSQIVSHDVLQLNPPLIEYFHPLTDHFALLGHPCSPQLAFSSHYT